MVDMIRASDINRKEYEKYIGMYCSYNYSSTNYVLRRLSKKYAYIESTVNNREYKAKKGEVMVYDLSETTRNYSYPSRWVSDLRSEYKYLIPEILSNLGNLDEWDIEEKDDGDILHYTIDGVKHSKEIKELTNEII